MASFSSILSDIGSVLKKVIGVAIPVAQALEPIVQIALPGLAPLYVLTVNEVVKAEAVALAAGAQNGTGAQKLAMVTQALEAEYKAFAAANGITYTPAALEAWVNAVVASLNAIPSLGTPAA